MLKNKLNLKKYLILNVFVFIIFFSCEQENKVENPTIGETSISINNNSLNDIYGSELDKLKNIAISGNYRIPISVAEQIAIETATKMREFEGILTKSALSISSIHKIKGNEKELVLDTKAEDSNNDSVSDMYLINFENNQGYVLMSGDERASGIISYSSEGQLKDTLDNAGQFILLEKATSLIDQKRKEFEQMETQLIVAAEEDIFKTFSKEKQDSLIKEGYFDANGKRLINKSASINCSLVPKARETNYCSVTQCKIYKSTIVGKLRQAVSVGPLVRTLWNQWDGYNNDILKNCKDGRRSPVGCVAVAVGQILAYHKKPSIINFRLIHWDQITMRNGNFSIYNNIVNFDNLRNINRPVNNRINFAPEIPFLLSTLGRSEYLKMDYNTSTCLSAAYSVDALATFKKLGYNKAYMTKYDNNLIINEIRNNRPVYIDGCGTNSSCHAWILDGYINILQDFTETTTYSCSEFNSTYTYYITNELVHNNFGWGNIATQTGWFSKGLFNASINASYTSNAFINNPFLLPTFQNRENNNNSNLNFKFDNDVIVNIK